MNALKAARKSSAQILSLQTKTRPLHTPDPLNNLMENNFLASIFKKIMIFFMGIQIVVEYNIQRNYAINSRTKKAK